MSMSSHSEDFKNDICSFSYRLSTRERLGREKCNEFTGCVFGKKMLQDFFIFTWLTNDGQVALLTTVVTKSD